MLNREYYIAGFEPVYTSAIIKALVGMRGTGKTTIFNQIMEQLKANGDADEKHIIYINFEYLENEKLRDINKLETYLKKKIVDLKQYYVFLDEIQYVFQFESRLVALAEETINISIFISSSNSRILPEDLNSCILGKYKSLYVTPFSYFETCKFLHTDPKNRNMLLNYLKYGGFPARLQCKKSSEVKKYLYSLLDSIFLKDIVIRLGIKDIEDITYIIKYFIQYLGKELPFSKIQEELLQDNKEIPEYRLLTDIDCLSKALIIRPSYGYNVHTDQILKGTFRYYLGDLGLGFLYGIDIQNHMEAILKNLVWIELKKRGYEVYTGINEDKQFDFVAIRKKKIMYIQVVYRLEDGSSVSKEVDKLEGFDSPFPRYLLSLDKEDFSRKGVTHKNIIDFLLDTSDVETDEDSQTWIAIE